MKDGNIPDANGLYTRYISIPVNPEKQGKEMFNAAQTIFNDEGKVYNLFNSNCNHKVQNILKAGGLNFSYGKGFEAVASEKLAYHELAETPKSELEQLGIVPNDAYWAGWRQWRSSIGFEHGSFKK